MLDQLDPLPSLCTASAKMAATQGFEGVTGTISYEPGSRIPSKSVAPIEVTDGKNSLLKIVMPEVVPEA